ncbi:hypothetical protein GCM10027288_21820 [Bordetella tumbae]
MHTGASFGQAQALPFPREQRYPKPVFQQSNLLTDCAGGDMQGFGGGLDAAALANFDKGA